MTFTGGLLFSELIHPGLPLYDLSMASAKGTDQSAKSMKVIPIRCGGLRIKQQQEIVELAFENWLARLGMLEGSPEEDFYKAQREVMARSLRPRAPSAGGLLVLKRPGS